MEFLEKLLNPELLRVAAASKLGVISLFFLLLSVIALVFFRSSGDRVKVFVFICMLLGALGFGFSLERALEETGVTIKNSNPGKLRLEDINCNELEDDGPCDFWVHWAVPEPGYQAIIRAGENNEGYFACGAERSKKANWGVRGTKVVLRYFQVKAEGLNHGCTETIPSVAPLAVSTLLVD